MKRWLVLTACVALAACAGADVRPTGRVMTGLDVLEAQGFSPLKGLRVGVITNRTGVDAAGRSIVDVLGSAPGLSLTVVFTAEHDQFAAVDSDALGRGEMLVAGKKIALVSLLEGGAAGMRPKPLDLARVDALVFDIQDSGARFDDDTAMMAMALEASKEASVRFFVLDRPNPLGGAIVEGPMADDVGLVGYEPVCYLPVVTRHGMTVGELAKLHNAAVHHPHLTVVKMRGWKRHMWYDETGLPWVAPSANIPDLASAMLAPGTGNLGHSNLSVGRGTASPFAWVGAPWLDAVALERLMNAALLEGVEFSADTRTPSKSEYAGQSVPGLRLKVTDREAVRPLRIFARLVVALRDRHAGDFDLHWNLTRKLVGRKSFKELYDRGADAAEIERLFDLDAAEFEKSRAPYLLYD